MSIISEIGGTRTCLRRHSGLACLEIRSRNEEAINSTRKIIYSLRVSYFLLYRRGYFLFLNWFSTRVSDDQKYVCGSSLCACISTRKFKGLDSREITSLPDIEKVIYMARHFNRRKNSMLITRLICIQWKFATPDHRYITQRFLVPISTVSARNAWHNDLPFVSQKFQGYFQKNWEGVWGTLLETLTLFQTWSKFWYPISDLKPWSPARDRSEWQAVTARTR